MNNKTINTGVDLELLNADILYYELHSEGNGNHYVREVGTYAFGGNYKDKNLYLELQTGINFINDNFSTPSSNYSVSTLTWGSDEIEYEDLEEEEKKLYLAIQSLIENLSYSTNPKDYIYSALYVGEDNELHKIENVSYEELNKLQIHKIESIEPK